MLTFEEICDLRSTIWLQTSLKLDRENELEEFSEKFAEILCDEGKDVDEFYGEALANVAKHYGNFSDGYEKVFKEYLCVARYMPEIKVIKVKTGEQYSGNIYIGVDHVI